MRILRFPFEVNTMACSAAATAPVESVATSVGGEFSAPSQASLANRKVLMVVNGEVYGGAERALDHLALRLGEHGFEVAFACLKPGRFPEVRQAQDTPLFEVPMRNRFDLRPVRKLVKLVRREQFEVIYAHTARTAMIASIVSRITGIPFVYHVQSPTARDTANRWKNFVNAAIERISLTRASALVPVSQSLGEYVRSQGFSAQMVSVVPNGSPCRAAAEWRNWSQGNPDQTEWTIGMTALIRPRKGIEVLLRAVAQLKKEGLPVRLRVVGPFETEAYGQKVKTLVDELDVADRIDWVGYTRDTNGELDKMDVFVLPSLFGEGTPLVLLEAMAAGLPIVTTRVEGNPELIRDGRDGLIVEPNDPQALAEALRSMIHGEVDLDSFRRSAREHHAVKFSDRAMAVGMASVLRRALGDAAA